MTDIERAVADRLESATTYINRDTDTVDGMLSEVIDAVVTELRDRVQRVVVAGIRNDEIHRRAAIGLLEVFGVAADEASEIAWAAAGDD